MLWHRYWRCVVSFSVKPVAIVVLLSTQLTFAADKSSSDELGARQPDVLIEAAWVRAMPPSRPNTAAYMMVSNEGETSLHLVGVRSEPEARVEMHTSREVDGMVRMERLQKVTIEPGQLVQFAPGGMHLMLLGLNRMPEPGERVKLCLDFQTGGSICTGAEVRRVAPSPDDNSQHHQHH